eukprot:1213643-Lingulodinium_polyedra.AAC.1
MCIRDSGSMAVLHGVTGEVMPISFGSKLTFNADGWGEIVHGDEKKPLKDMLRYAIFANNQGQKYRGDKETGEVKWLHQLLKQHGFIFPACQVAGKSCALACCRLAAPHQGQHCWWSM